jgi:hypothetical protein
MIGEADRVPSKNTPRSACRAPVRPAKGFVAQETGGSSEGRDSPLLSRYAELSSAKLLFAANKAAHYRTNLVLEVLTAVDE